jgi:hypothetical protein
MTAKSGGWAAYIDAMLRIDAPDGVIWVRPTAISRSTGQYPDPEGRTICVITAHNPGGRVASDAENASAQARLLEELDRRGLTWWSAAGGDPSWTHVEASAAVIGIAEADAIVLGAQFGQDAIFVLTPADRQVVGCAERRIVATGWSIESQQPEGNAGTSWPTEMKKAAADHHEGPGESGTDDIDEDEDIDEGEEELPPAEAVDQPGSLAGTVVLVDVGDDPERLFVIPVDAACSELRTYATLVHAGTYRDVLADVGAVETVVEALGRRLDERDEDDEGLEEGLSARELFDRRVAEDASFSTDAVFGEEGWREWCPDHRAATERFVRRRAPRLWERFGKGDGGWGIDYDPVDQLPAADQDQILARLQALGCEILPCPELDQQYWNPDRDLAARIDAGKWPPRSGEPESTESDR